MIPTIGLMIGAYIFVRSWEMICTPRESGTERTVIVILAICLMGIDALCTLGLVASGSSIPTLR